MHVCIVTSKHFIVKSNDRVEYEKRGAKKQQLSKQPRDIFASWLNVKCKEMNIWRKHSPFSQILSEWLILNLIEH